MDSTSSFSVMASLLTTAMMRSDTSSSVSFTGRWRMSPGLGVSSAFGLGGGATGSVALPLPMLLGRLGQRAEAIGELGTNLGQLTLAGHAGQALVERQSLVDLGHIVFGQEPFDGHVDDRFDGDPGPIAFQFLHSFGEKLAVKIV